MRSKLYPQERTVGSSKCNSPRCLTCKNVQECDTFTSHVTKEASKINHHFHCNSKCLVYLLSCKVCGKQYVGSTTDKFRFQWNSYKNCQCLLLFLMFTSLLSDILIKLPEYIMLKGQVFKGN